MPSVTYIEFNGTTFWDTLDGPKSFPKIAHWHVDLASHSRRRDGDRDRISAVAQCYQAKSTMMQNWKPPRLPRSINAVTSSVSAALRAGTGILLPLVRRTTAHIVRAASTPDSDPRFGLEFADAASAGWGDRGNKGYGKPKSRRALSRPILRRSSSLISQLSNQFAASA
jgi:hypothetical protein